MIYICRSMIVCRKVQRKVNEGPLERRSKYKFVNPTFLEQI